MSHFLDLTTGFPRRYRYQIRRELTLWGRWQVSFELVGARGGINLHAERFSEDNIHPREWEGGLEVHFRSPPAGMVGDRPPDHDNCWLLHAPCWHDGSSAIIADVYAPMLDAGDEDRILRRLTEYADEQFGVRGDA